MDVKIAVFFAGLSGVCLAANVSNYMWKDCASDIKRCVTHAMDILRPYMRTGIPEFNLPTLDPFRLPEIRYKLKYGNFSGTFISRNMYVENTSGFELKDASLDVDNGIFILDLYFPELKIVSDCKVNFKVMFAEQNLNGSFVANAMDVDVKMIFYLNTGENEIVAGDGFHNIKTKKEVGDYSVEFDFENDNCYDKILNGILNVNKKLYIASFMPVVEEKSNLIFRNIAKNVLKSESFSAVFNGI